MAESTGSSSAASPASFAAPSSNSPELLAGWIASVALGDRAAYRRLYDASSPKLFAVALRILRDDARAEDVLQDSFINVWNGASGYDASRAAPMTWMVTIVRNRALDYLRRVEHRDVALDDDVEAALESHEPTPPENASRRQEALALERCLDGLEPGPRQVIAVAYFRGLTHSELASSLRLPIGTVKTWIRRGLEKLRQCLDGAVA